MTKRVAVIGAGPSGLAQLRSFKSAQDKGADIPEVVCFEKQSDWGGLWNYSWRTGLDKNGEPVHCSMYRYLWSNGPKECLEFADYTFEEHFGKLIPSYPPRAVLWDYIKGRVEKANVRSWIEFNTPVRNICYLADEEKFHVSVHNHDKNKTRTEVFDSVIVATGHFSVPNVPEFKGFDKFEGRILHSHDFRDAREFTGKDILVVGGSYSAEDIGTQCYKYGAKSITSCYRSQPMGFHWPDNWQEKPLLTHTEGNIVYFSDGDSKKIDAIILCTGYQHHFPFITSDLRLQTDNRMWTKNLYKGVVWEANPKLFYLAMQDQFYTFNMFDAQAWYVRDIMLNRIKLPNLAAMKQHDKIWEEREATLETEEDMIVFQGDYVQELIDETDYPSFDVDGVNKTFLAWEDHKHDDIMGYRNHSYRSLMTGNVAPPHHTPWLEAMDDSLEEFLKSK